MADDRRTEEDNENVPATNFQDRVFRRYGPGSVMDHTAMLGTLDTTETGGTYGPSALMHLAPIFRVSAAHDLAVAARAMDPDDPEVPEEHVQVSSGLTVVQGDPEGQKRRVADAARRAQERLGQDFDPQYVPPVDRTTEAERAWAASVAGMRPTMVEGGNNPITLDPTPDLRAEEPPQEPAEPFTAPEDPEPPAEPAKPKSESQKRSQDDLPGIPRRASVRRPNKAASKEAWQDWARQCGASEEELRTATREHLIETYANQWPTQK